MTLIRVNHQASHELVLLFSRFVQQWIDLFDLWERIKLQGRKKGFSEKELAEMARPYLKQRGMSKDKIYYLFHREEQNERVRRRKITTMTAKSIPLKSLPNYKIRQKGKCGSFPRTFIYLQFRFSNLKR